MLSPFLLVLRFRDDQGDAGPGPAWFESDGPGPLIRALLGSPGGPHLAFPTLAGTTDAIGALAEPVPIPWDCADCLPTRLLGLVRPIM